MPSWTVIKKRKYIYSHLYNLSIYGFLCVYCIETNQPNVDNTQGC